MHTGLNRCKWSCGKLRYTMGMSPILKPALVRCTAGASLSMLRWSISGIARSRCPPTLMISRRPQCGITTVLTQQFGRMCICSRSQCEMRVLRPAQGVVAFRDRRLAKIFATRGVEACSTLIKSLFPQPTMSFKACQIRQLETFIKFHFAQGDNCSRLPDIARSRDANLLDHTSSHRRPRAPRRARAAASQIHGSAWLS
jgi:hypothetical protein